MANHLKQLLDKWSPQKDEVQWVLATIIETAGSSYRKAGAMMMINSLGQYHGLLSGGCLESDIMRQSRRCWEDGRNRVVEYDMREEEDLAWQLGIGCGGMVKILLQPVSEENDYLSLNQVHACLADNSSGKYQINTLSQRPENLFEQVQLAHVSNKVSVKDGVFTVDVTAPFHIAVFGGGIDAIPLVNLAAEIGWQVTLIDPRSSYARASVFKRAHNIIREPVDSLKGALWLAQIDVAILMNHNVTLDAECLELVQHSQAKYIGVLGPIHRTDRVLDAGGLSREGLVKRLSNPVGLRLGGELPESIALSILSEAHAYLEAADGQSISGLLGQ